MWRCTALASARAPARVAVAPFLCARSLRVTPLCAPCAYAETKQQMHTNACAPASLALLSTLAASPSSLAPLVRRFATAPADPGNGAAVVRLSRTERKRAMRAEREILPLPSSPSPSPSSLRPVQPARAAYSALPLEVATKIDRLNEVLPRWKVDGVRNNPVLVSKADERTRQATADELLRSQHRQLSDLTTRMSIDECLAIVTAIKAHRLFDEHSLAYWRLIRPSLRRLKGEAQRIADKLEEKRLDQQQRREQNEVDTGQGGMFVVRRFWQSLIRPLQDASTPVEEGKEETREHQSSPLDEWESSLGRDASLSLLSPPLLDVPPAVEGQSTINPAAPVASLAVPAYKETTKFQRLVSLSMDCLCMATQTAGPLLAVREMTEICQSADFSVDDFDAACFSPLLKALAQHYEKARWPPGSLARVEEYFRSIPVKGSVTFSVMSHAYITANQLDQADRLASTAPPSASIVGVRLKLLHRRVESSSDVAQVATHTRAAEQLWLQAASNPLVMMGPNVTSGMMKLYDAVIAALTKREPDRVYLSEQVDGIVARIQNVLSQAIALSRAHPPPAQSTQVAGVTVGVSGVESTDLAYVDDSSWTHVFSLLRRTPEPVKYVALSDLCWATVCRQHGLGGRTSTALAQSEADKQTRANQHTQSTHIVHMHGLGGGEPQPQASTDVAPSAAPTGSGAASSHSASSLSASLDIVIGSYLSFLNEIKQHSRFAAAWAALGEQQKEGQPHLTNAFLMHCAETGASAAAGREMMQYALRVARGRNRWEVRTMTAWIMVYKRRGDVEGAEAVLKKMREVGVEPNNLSYAALIHVLLGALRRALDANAAERQRQICARLAELEGEMKQRGITFTLRDYEQLMKTSDRVGLPAAVLEWRRAALAALGGDDQQFWKVSNIIVKAQLSVTAAPTRR